MFSTRSVANSMVKRVVESLGAINILHNNAASKSTDLDAFFAPPRITHSMSGARSCR